MKKFRQVRTMPKRWNSSIGWYRKGFGKRTFSCSFPWGKQGALPPQPPTLFSQHTRNMYMNWPSGCKLASSAQLLAVSLSSSRWGGTGRGTSWCPHAVGLLPVGWLLPATANQGWPREAGADVLGRTTGHAWTRVGQEHSQFSTQGCLVLLVPRGVDMGTGANTHPSSGMDLRPLCQDAEKLDL